MIKSLEVSMVYQLLLSGCQPRYSLFGLLTSDWRSFRRGRNLKLQVLDPSAFSTPTQWKLLWFTNFYCLAVSQDIPFLGCSFLIGGVLEEGGASTCRFTIHPQCLVNTNSMEASMLYQLPLFDCQPKHSIVSFLTSDWSSFTRGQSLQLSR